MIEIDCLICGKSIKIPNYVDTENYDGQVSCWECDSLLHVKLVGAKVRRYEVVKRGPQTAALAGLPGADAPPPAQAATYEVASIARYYPLRDFLVSYRASQIQLAFEQIEDIISAGLGMEAYTLRSWWDNDRRNPQALAWLEAGWEVADVNLQQRGIVLRRAAA